jgi:hypothetical protein
VLGRSIVIEPVSGRTTYRPPGQARALPLSQATVVPVGTIVDTRRGTIRITTASPTGGTQTGTFHDSPFQIGQQAGDGVVVLALRGGPFPHCGGGCTSAVRRRATSRRLWGSATGSFRLRGRYAAATVRGTNWMIEDHPGDTLVRVRRGSVLVRDFVNDRDVVLNEGESYVARVIYVNRRPGNPRFGQRYTLRLRQGRVVHVYLTRERVVVGR